MDNLSWPSLIHAAAAILASLLFLPLSSIFLFVSHASQTLMPRTPLRQRLRRSSRFRQRKILVTGIATPQGLHIARAFYQTGHDVIGADFVSTPVPMHVRFSKAISKIYHFRAYQQEDQACYVEDILGIVATDKVDLWINCSNLIPALLVAQTKEVLERRTACICLALLTADAAKLSTRDRFLKYAREIGLPTPEVHRVTSRREVHEVLGGAQGKKKYILNAPNGTAVPNSQTVLPKRTLSQTYGEISKLTISNDQIWVLEQYFATGEQYSTYTVVVYGKVVAFAASVVAETTASQQSVTAESGIGRAMLQFMQTFAEVAGKGFTSQLSITFRVDEKATETGIERNIFPIDCETSAQTPVLLFTGTAGAISLVKSYLSTFTPSINGNSPLMALNSTEEELATPFVASAGIYFLGQDLSSLILMPFLRLLQLEVSLLQFAHGCAIFLNHVTFWREGLFCVWDPLPFLWLYHVSTPVRLVAHVLSNTPWHEHDAFILQ